MAVELTDAFFAKAAGWEAMKRARAYLEQGQVLSSHWDPPLLKGVVQAGGTSYRAGFVIKNAVDIDNLCPCRESREWGTLCAHSVSIGLHWVHGQKPAPAPAAPSARPGSKAGSPAGARSAPAPGTVLSRSPDRGEPLQIWVLLAPNFEAALARGRVGLFFEGEWRGGRVPLNALPKQQLFRLETTEWALLDAIEQLAQGETPALLTLTPDELAGLLPALKGHPRITLGKGAVVEVRREPWSPPMRARLQPDGEIDLRLADAIGAGVLRVGAAWVWRERAFQPLALAGTFAAVLAGPMRVTRAQVPLFLSQEWPRLLAGGTVEANFRLEDFSVEPQAPRFVLNLAGGLARLDAILQCRYGTRVMTLGVTSSQEGVWLPDPDVPTRYGTRDPEAERAAVARLVRAGFTGPDAQGRWQLLGQSSVLNFFAREHPRMEREWEVTLEERLQRSTAQNLERIEPRFTVNSSGVQWFDLGVVYSSSSGETFSAADIQRLLLAGQGHVRLRNGRTAVIDTGAVEELQEVLLDCAPRQHADGYRINAAQAGFLDATLREHPQWQVQAPSAWRERAAQLGGPGRIECPPLGSLDAVLRPYQKHGVAWLHFLRAHGFGGILADEMGLGKTLQALAFLRSCRGAASTGKPWLVICPTSLVYNWASEAARFTPDLRVCTLQGARRHEDFAAAAQADLVLTSYALLRRDWERHREIEFDTVILDEAQHIKNRESQNAQAVKSVRCAHRLVLTGTPLENSVLDLWSIFDFLMPGYLGTAQEFRERYEVPIVRAQSAEARSRLARRLKPFLLRRIKREVAADLPEKIDQVAHCELTEAQQAVYQQVIEASRREILAAVGEQGFARSRMVIFAALLRLRQICCDLRLLDLPGIDPAGASGKLELFDELLDEVIDGGHRVLVFSQFTSLLALVQERLRAAAIEFCYLDGSTRDRGAVVDRFQRDASVPVFLISLKAGGVGLNLTGADTVIHLDPWWNPAIEDQATGRAHRIGQTRTVTSYKLIARGTIEEKIVQLQERKRDLFQGVLAGEESLGQALTWDDVQDLLSYPQI